MRDRERRLRRVTTRMTVRQRVAALLAAGPGNTAVYDDIGRGLTPAGWAAFHRDCARLDQLNATARACLARAESGIDMLQWIAYRRSTTTLLAILVEGLQDALDGWQPRHGRAGAADRDLDGEVRGIARVLRGMMEDAAGTAHPAPPPPMDALLRDGVPPRAPSAPRVGDRGRRVRGGTRRRSARRRTARSRGPLPYGPRGAHRSDHAGSPHRADRAVRRRDRGDRGALPPRGGLGGG